MADVAGRLPAWLLLQNSRIFSISGGHSAFCAAP
jgi:hypothetical protein